MNPAPDTGPTRARRSPQAVNHAGYLTLQLQEAYQGPVPTQACFSSWRRKAVQERIRSGRPAFGTKTSEFFHGADYSIGKDGPSRQEKEYRAAIEAIASGTWDMTQSVPLGETPAAIVASGADQLPMTMPSSMVKKVTETGHDIPLDVVKQIAGAMKDPLFVMESATVPDAVTVLLDLKHNGNNVLVAVHLNKREDNHEVNRIASVYDKSNPRAVEGWIKSGLLRYANQKKGNAWFRSRGLQLPKEGSKRYNKNLLTEQDIVKPVVNYSIGKAGDDRVLMRVKGGRP